MLMCRWSDPLSIPHPTTDQRPWPRARRCWRPKQVDLQHWATATWAEFYSSAKVSERMAFSWLMPSSHIHHQTEQGPTLFLSTIYISCTHILHSAPHQSVWSVPCTKRGWNRACLLVLSCMTFAYMVMTSAIKTPDSPFFRGCPSGPQVPELHGRGRWSRWSQVYGCLCQMLLLCWSSQVQ